MRVTGDGPLTRATPGSRIALREACIAARMVGGKVHATSLARADMAIFADGTRCHRDGRLERGRRPTDPGHQWVGAMHMPGWASRATLVVSAVREERLRRITRRGVRAEGAIPLLGGLLWRWPAPIPGLYAGATRAFAHHWDLHHTAPGTGWGDDPLVTVIGFRVESARATPPGH